LKKISPRKGLNFQSRSH